MRRVVLVALLVALSTGVSAQIKHLRFTPAPLVCVGTTVTTADDIGALATAAATGTVFCLQAGTHRQRSVTPKTNQQFISVTGAIMSGAKILTGAVTNAPYWYYTGQTQQGTVNNEGGASCVTGHDPICAQPEDVFYDGLPLEKVASLGAGGTGKFFFDYPADIIYIWDTPVGHVVETSVTPQAFLPGTATGVTIRGLTVQNYATPTTVSAIEMGASWIVEANIVRYNHYSGIRSTTNGIVRDNWVHHNGAFGLNGSGSFITIERNEVSYNDAGTYAFYNPGQGAGGSKWVFTDNLIVRGNYSHHNYGPGLWTDINNITVLYEYNDVEFNCDSGIFQEVGYDAIIRYNYAQGNGTCQLFPDWMFGAGIAISSSRNVEVYGNTLVNNWQGIGALDSGRSGEGENNGAWLLTNLHVHDNTITQTTDLGTATGISGIVRGTAAVSGAFPTYTTANNRYRHNDYRFGSYANYFHWNDGTYNDTAWFGFGQDTNSAFRRTAGINRVQQASVDVFSDNPLNPNPAAVLFPQAVTAGNLGIVLVRGGAAGTATVAGVTDTLGTTYSLITSNVTQDPNLYLFAGTFPSTGANRAAAAWSTANTNFIWLQAIEVYTGSTATSTASGATASGTGATDQVCAALTTAGPAYLVSAASISGLNTYTAGTDSLSHGWFLVNGSLGRTTNLFGGVQEYVSTGTLTADIPHITSSTGTGAYTTVCAAFK